MPSVLQALSCADGYDPNSLHVDRARDLILGLLQPVSGTQRVFVREALDRVLAADAISPIDVPAHDNSAMDGWALRFGDLAAEGETRLRIAGTAYAGRAFEGRLGAGDAVRIMTGAVLPHGVDCVAVQEVARVEDDRVVIPPRQRAGQNTRRAGEDLARGQQRPDRQQAFGELLVIEQGVRSLAAQPAFQRGAPRGRPLAQEQDHEIEVTRGEPAAHVRENHVPPLRS